MSPRHVDIKAPPLEPIGEVVVDGQREFSARCQALVVPFLLKSNWELQRELVTRGAEWGLVWRGDYAIADLAAPHLFNRIMCWEGADGNFSPRSQPVGALRRCRQLGVRSPAMVTDRTASPNPPFAVGPLQERSGRFCKRLVLYDP